MDFSHAAHAAYFPGTQPYEFLGIAPLTPSHSRSPPEVFENFPNGVPHDGFQNFDNYVQFGAAQTFPGPPTPPGPHPAAVQPVNGVVHPSHAPEVLPLGQALDLDDPNQSRRQGSNSEEDELTPAQSRRKAQNRAAQRAFRERKERHVKELETRLQQLEAAQQETVSENERLRRDLQKMSTENEILRATSVVGAAGSPASNATPTTTGPMSYNPTDFYSNVLQNHANKTPSHRIVESDDGERLLAAGATWEYIISHELYKQGLVDVGLVSERLKPQAKCDGQGPVFAERAIREAIEHSVASGTDELL